MIFVNSMSDLFHDAVSDEFIAQVWAVMALTPQHIYQILTKRHGRMRSLLNSDLFTNAVIDAVADHPLLDRRREQGRWPLCEWDGTLPLPGVWLGVSVEDQKHADLRIPALLETPASVRFLSCEPLIGAVNLGRYLTPAPPGDKLWCPTARQQIDVIGSAECTCARAHVPGQRLHWVIIGGESGPGSRACDPTWVQSLVDQCRVAGVPAFVKQDSGPRAGMQGRLTDELWAVKEFPVVVL
jgi:protein gp37